MSNVPECILREQFLSNGTRRFSLHCGDHGWLLDSEVREEIDRVWSEHVRECHGAASEKEKP